MRTTVNLDKDIVDVARSLAATEGISLGAAISALARRGISGGEGRARTTSDSEQRFPAFNVAEEAPTFGTDEVKRALDDE